MGRSLNTTTLEGHFDIKGAALEIARKNTEKEDAVSWTLVIVLRPVTGAFFGRREILVDIDVGKFALRVSPPTPIGCT